MNRITHTNAPNYTPELLKMAAVALMVLDHTGIVLDDNIILRSLGRLALPLFVYQLTSGFLASSNHIKTIKLLFIFALISYFPYNIFIQTNYLHNLINNLPIASHWNVFLPLAIAYFVLMLIEAKKYVPMLLLLLLPMLIDMDYDWLIPAASIAIYFILKSKMKKSVQWVAIFCTYFFLNFIYTLQIDAVWYQLIAPLGIPIAAILMKIDVKIRLPKLFYYWFYPIHLLILKIL